MRQKEEFGIFRPVESLIQRYYKRIYSNKETMFLSQKDIERYYTGDQLYMLTVFCYDCKEKIIIDGEIQKKHSKQEDYYTCKDCLKDPEKIKVVCSVNL